jgi:hypothetical protein
MRLRLQTADNEWAVDLDGHRIDVHKNLTSTTTENLGPLEDFCRDASQLVARVSRVLAVSKGHRLALVTKTWLRDLTSNGMEQAYACLFNPLPYYEAFTPGAWNLRTVARVPISVGGTDEKANVILTADRAERRFLFDATQPPFESIQVEVDVNTYHANTETRFTPESLPEFLGHAVELREVLLKQFRERVNG